MLIPTVKEVNIQYYSVYTKDFNNAKTIWVKDVPYIKEKITREKPIQVTECIIRVPKEFFNSKKMYS